MLRCYGPRLRTSPFRKCFLPQKSSSIALFSQLLDAKHTSGSLLSDIQNLTSSIPTIPQRSLQLVAERICAAQQPDFRELINYRVLIEELLESGYFEDQPVWFIYLTCYRPLIKPLPKDNYTQRLHTLMSSLDFVQERSSVQEDADALNKLLYPDLVETIKDSILVGDSESSQFLMDQLDKIYGGPLPDDFHTLLFSALEVFDIDVLERFAGDYKHVYPSIPLTEGRLMEIALSRANQYQNLISAWDSKTPLDSFRASLIIELLHKSLGVSSSLLLLDHFIPLIQDELSHKDFDFLSQQLVSLLKYNSVKRKKFEQREASETSRPSKLYIQRIDIKNTFEQISGILNAEAAISVKELFANLFLKSVSESTNISGVIYAYSLLPLHLLNPSSYEIIFHACSKGHDSGLRIFELFNYACSKMVLSQKSFHYLIKTSLGSTDDRLWFYLHHYFQHYETLSPQMVSEVKSHDLSTIDLVSQKEVVQQKFASLGGSVFLKNFKPTVPWDPYDSKEQKMLERKHANI